MLHEEVAIFLLALQFQYNSADFTQVGHRRNEMSSIVLDSFCLTIYKAIYINLKFPYS